jgi:hypothetical protein
MRSKWLAHLSTVLDLGANCEACPPPRCARAARESRVVRSDAPSHAEQKRDSAPHQRTPLLASVMLAFYMVHLMRYDVEPRDPLTRGGTHSMTPSVMPRPGSPLKLPIGPDKDELAWVRLRTALARHRLKRPFDLFEHAMELRDGSGNKKKLHTATLILKLILDAAGADDVPRPLSAAAARELGRMHMHGEGIAVDVDAAAFYYRQASGHGDANAQHILGAMHSTGLGAPRDPALAATLLHFAAEDATAGAQLSMGFRHLLGVAAPRLCQKSLLYYTPVADKVAASVQQHRAERTVEKIRLAGGNPQIVGKRGADDDVIRYYELSALKVN